jgi:integrase
VQRFFFSLEASMARQRKRGIRGAGTVFQRQDGRWEAKFKVEETGKYKSLYAPTEKEAYKKLQDALYQQNQGTLAIGRDQTVKQFLEYWLEDVEKPDVRVGTYVGNRVLVHKHLIPGIGHIKLQKLTPQRVQSFYATKLKGGTSSSRVKQMQGVLHKALDHARDIKLVGMNAAEGVKLPKYEKHKPQVLSPEQARLLLNKARERGLETVLALAVGTGMREGEILGLRWSDFDFVKSVLQISRTVDYIPGYGFVEGKPKTQSSERAILLPQFLVVLLKAHRALQLETRLKAGTKWIDRDLVFPNGMGNYQFDTSLRRQFYRVLDVAELPRMRFHDLRHSAATILISMGVPANVVQKLLGHSDVATTLGIYGSVLPSMQQDAANRMDDVFEERP